MNNTVGIIDWDCCDRCRHYRRHEGGCLHLDEKGKSILEIDDEYFEYVNCDMFEELQK
jgi:hypothetical protein